mgnify:CR=1 FL=1
MGIYINCINIWGHIWLSCLLQYMGLYIIIASTSKQANKQEAFYQVQKQNTTKYEALKCKALQTHRNDK